MNKRQRKKAAKKLAELESARKEPDPVWIVFERFSRTMEGFANTIANHIADSLERLANSMTPVLKTLEKWEKTRQLLVIAYKRSKEIKMIEYRGDES